MHQGWERLPRSVCGQWRGKARSKSVQPGRCPEKSNTAGSKSQLYALNGSTWEYQSVPTQEEDIALVTSEDGPKLRLASQSGKLYAHSIAYGTYTTGSFAQENITGVSNNTLGAAPEVLSNRYLLTTGNKVYSYTGSTWQEESTFTSDKDMVSLSGSLQNSALPMLGGLTGALQYKQGGTWTKANPVKIQPIADLAHDGTLSIAVGQKGTLLKSTDFGTTWSPRLSNVNNSDFSTAAIKGSKALAGTSDGKLVYSNNSGDSWAAASFSPTNTDAITAISIPSATEAWVLAGTKVYYSSNFSSFTKVMDATQSLRGIYIGADGYGYIVGDAGMAYRIQPTGTYNDDQKLQASGTATPATPSTLGTTAYSALKIATDANVTDDKGTGIPQRPLRTVQFSDRLVGYLTGTEGLILKTSDGGYHWQRESAEANSSASSTTFIEPTGENATIATGNQIGNVRDRAQQLGTRYWYDELGRLVLSQNSKQYNIGAYLGEQQYLVPAADLATLVAELMAQDPTQNATLNTQNPRAYSYTLYDEIGRIKEVGELLTRSNLSTYKTESQVLYSELPAFIGKGVRQQITRTYYDEQVFELEVNGVPLQQQNLRPRVASVTYSDRQSPAGGGAGGGSYDRATHYSYDIHGNVKTLVQEIKSNVQGLSSNVIAKRLDYDYDLIGGQVEYTYYQKDQLDQLVHKYTYDGDNRITQVYTSTDGINWVRDIKYEYYAHGPLAKTVIGDLGVDNNIYAYTLEGWIKGVKGQNFSYALGYNSTDYKSISSASYGGETVGLRATPVANNTSGKSTGLYNGNIATWSTNTPKLAEKGVQYMTNQYKYDQLNRISESKTLGFASSNAYTTRYNFDENGNILALQRYNEVGQKFDAFKYNYEDKKSGYLANSNKLRWVDDSTTDQALHAEDLEDQGIDNYQYDDIGNLKSDIQEEIERIEWTTSGKVAAVYRIQGSLKPNLVFTYDATGNRLTKTAIKGRETTKTYYIRDALGTVLATYTSTESSLITLQEQYLYGHSRLGVLANGTRSYEQVDHLGNVRAVVGEFGEVKAAYDYYAYGMSLAKVEGGYRFGFNGKEIDIEGMGGGGATYDYGFRIYNANIARFLSIDPLSKSYPWYTPYQFAGNKPIMCIDLDGMEEQPTMENTTPTDPNDIVYEGGTMPEVVVTAKLTGWQKFSTFTKSFVKAAGTAVVLTAAVVVVAGTMGAAGPILIGAAVAWGAYEAGKTGYELVSGKEAYTGRELTEKERWQKGGELAGGFVGGFGGAKGGIKIKAKLFSGKSKAKITEGVNEGSGSSPENIEVKEMSNFYYEIEPGEGGISVDIILQTGEKLNFSSNFKKNGNVLEFKDAYLAPEKGGIENHAFKNKLGRDFLKLLGEQLKEVAGKIGAESFTVDYVRDIKSSSANPGQTKTAGPFKVE